MHNGVTINMTSKADTSAPWGTYAPQGRDKPLLLMNTLGLAHGAFKHFIARQWLKRHPDTPVDIRYHDIKYRLYPVDNTVDLKLLFGSKYRDRVELEALTRTIRQGGVFVDIGANTGYYSLTAAAAGAGRVIAIEPYPPTFARLRFNIATNQFEDRIQAIQTALGDHAGEATLYVPEVGDVGSSRISEQAISGRPVTVPLRPLPDILAERSVSHIDALKIDVEGMEDAVLMPFFETTGRDLWPGLIIIEHISSNDWRRDVLAWMLANGYRQTGQTRSNTLLEKSLD